MAHYPRLPPAAGASLATQGRFNLVLSPKVLGLTLMLRPAALLLPPLRELLFWVVASIALGHGLFEGLAHVG